MSQVSNQISGTPFTQRNHFHLRTCFHFSLDSKRLVSFCFILIFCFDLIHRHFLLDKLKRGKQLDPVRVSLLKPLSGNGNFCRYFFSSFFLFCENFGIVGEREREKKKKQKSRTLREAADSIKRHFRRLHCGVRSGPNARGLSRSVFFFFFFLSSMFYPVKAGRQ